jgi:hypothetical protein
MPAATPLTNTSAALRDVISAAQHVRKDITWPGEALAQVRSTFNRAIGDFLTHDGAEYPELDLWNGSAFADFKHYVLREVVPAVVNAAVGELHDSRAMTAAAIRDAAFQVLHEDAIIKGIKDALEASCKKAGHPRIMFDCPSPPVLPRDTVR